MLAKGSSILGLDTGRARVGVAIATRAARWPRPLTTLKADDSLMANIKALVETENVAEVVVGLPRNLSGDDTDQTRQARQFAGRLRAELAVPVRLQDEALTTQKATTELRVRKKPGPGVTVDSLAAAYILADYLSAGTDARL